MYEMRIMIAVQHSSGIVFKFSESRA